jgi:hypothetical protein
MKAKHNRTHEMRYSFCSDLIISLTLTLHKDAESAFDENEEKKNKISISFMPRLRDAAIIIDMHTQ